MFVFKNENSNLEQGVSLEKEVSLDYFLEAKSQKEDSSAGG